MRKELMTVKQELGRGGALCKEFNRTRLEEGMNWRVEMHYALAAMDANDQLKACDPQSVGRALIDLGVMGLTLSPAMKYAYLIPYGRECTVSPSYMGLEQIAYRTGFVSMIQCVLVKAGDKFEVWTDDGGRHIRHIEQTNPTMRKDVTHAYCIATFSSGLQHVEVMDKQELLACKDAATQKNKGKVPFTWTGKFRGEMYKKCVMRRGWKHWPKVTNPQLVSMMEAVNRSDPMEFADNKVVSTVDGDKEATLDQIQINILIEMMREAGVVDRGYDPWLQSLAESLGYQGRAAIRKVLVADFDQVEERMKEGLEKWVQSQASAASPSEPVDSTARRVET